MGEANFYYFTCLKFNLDSVKHFIQNMTKRTQKVGITGKYATRYGASLKNGEEDGGVSTRHLHLPLLRQGRIEEKGRRCLALQRMQKDDCRRSLGPFNHGCRHRQKRHPSSSRDQGTSIILLQLGTNGFLG